MKGKNKWTKKFGIFKQSVKYSIPVFHPTRIFPQEYIEDTMDICGHYIRPPLDENSEDEDEESEA